MDVAKVDWDIAYVAMVVHVCYKGLLPMLYLCFLDACCKCVYLDVAYVSHRPPSFSSDIEVDLFPSNCMRSVIYIVSAVYVYTLLVARYRCPDGPAR